MTSFGSLYSRVEEALPAVYRRDSESWRQIRDFFGPLNELSRDFILSLSELPSWLSPAAVDATPPGSRDASPDELLGRRDEVLDEIASWFDFEFRPRSLWSIEAASDLKGLVHAKSEALRILPRLMRSRATPVGFLELFCTVFRLSPDDANECPILIDHCWFRSSGVEPPSDPPATQQPDDQDPVVFCDSRDSRVERDSFAWQITMLVPSAAAQTWDRWREMESWVEANAPAHLTFNLERVSDEFWRDGLPELIDGDPDIDTILAGVRSNVVPGRALHLGPGEADGRQLARDTLDFGRLPGPDEGESL